MNIEKFKPHHARSKGGPRTLLSVGAVTFNVIDAAIHVANQIKVPIQLAVTRKVADSESLEKGTLGWSTEKLAEHVRERDEGDYVILTRAQGGPRHGAAEKTTLARRYALERTKTSFDSDIASGFDVLHLDMSCHNTTWKQVKLDTEQLVAHCEEKSDKLAYEFTIEHDEPYVEYVDFARSLSPKIQFIASRTRMEGGGTYDKELTRKRVAECNQRGLWYKEYFADFCMAERVRNYVNDGVHAAYVGIDFGSEEATKLMDMLSRYKMKKELNRFIALACEASAGLTVKPDIKLTDSDKAILLGHHCLHLPEVEDIKEKLAKEVSVDVVLRSQIISRILFYLKGFGWLH